MDSWKLTLEAYEEWQRMAQQLNPKFNKVAFRDRPDGTQQCFRQAISYVISALTSEARDLRYARTDAEKVIEKLQREVHLASKNRDAFAEALVHAEGDLVDAQREIRTLTDKVQLQQSSIRGLVQEKEGLSVRLRWQRETNAKLERQLYEATHLQRTPRRTSHGGDFESVYHLPWNHFRALTPEEILTRDPDVEYATIFSGIPEVDSQIVSMLESKSDGQMEPLPGWRICLQDNPASRLIWKRPSRALKS